MKDENGQNIKIEITQGKLLDLLMHSATREDISELRTEMHQRIDSSKNELKKEIADVKTELKAEIADVKTDMKSLSERMDSNFKWTLGILIVAILVPIALHFVS